MSFKLLQLFVVDKEEHDIKEVSPKSMVEDIVAHLKPTLEEQHIQISCTTQEGTAMLEPDLTRTLLLNLIDNSRKAMELDGNSEKVGQISIDQSMIPDGVKYVIKDNGKGMPQESIEHITEAFYRVDKARSRAQGGAGIGMSLVAKIVEIHNGTLDISSEEGVGTTITIELKGGPVKNEG